MITNGREYQITRAQLARLATAVGDAKAHGPAERVHPTIHQAEVAALESEMERLQREIAAYDELVAGNTAQLKGTGLEDFPEVLIKARIANQWTQKQLADRLGTPEQQVQRWEATRYRGVSFERLLAISKTLGISVEQKVIVAAPLARKAREFVRELGLTDEFVRSRILNAEVSGDLDAPTASTMLDRFRHIFGWSIDDLAAANAPMVRADALGGARLKVPRGRNASILQVYTAYAYHVAIGAARSAAHLPKRSAPPDASGARQVLLARGRLTLTAIAEWAWSLGVPVIPLEDSGAFHGALWRVEGRNVIILKQKTRSIERLMHDALHEIYHAAQEPDRPSRSVVDTEDPFLSNEQEELAANQYASDVLLDGRANDLAFEVAREAGKKGPALKSAVVRVAQRANVPIGALANHLAWILERQKVNPISWWGAAQNLQTEVGDEVARIRDVAFQNLVPPSGSDVDVELLFSALRAAGAS